MGGVGRPARHHVGCGAVLLAPPSLSLSDCVHSCGFPTLGFRIVRAWGPVDCSRMVLRAYSQRHLEPWCMQRLRARGVLCPPPRSHAGQLPVVWPLRGGGSHLGVGPCVPVHPARLEVPVDWSRCVRVCACAAIRCHGCCLPHAAAGVGCCTTALLSTGSGLLGPAGADVGSYMTLVPPEGPASGFTLVVETMGKPGAVVEVALLGGLPGPGTVVHVWQTTQVGVSQKVWWTVEARGWGARRTHSAVSVPCCSVAVLLFAVVLRAGGLGQRVH
jgi:hypothetical protein